MSRVPARQQEITTTPQAKSSLQYDLFRVFHGDPAQLSNTIEFWDSIPRYAYSARQQAADRRAGKLKELYKQEFRWTPQPKIPGVHHVDLILTMAPAKLEDKATGDVIEVFPSADEELIEEVLRKIYADQSGLYGQHDEAKGKSRVAFTLGHIYRELQLRGKTRSYEEILHSLHVMTGTHLTIASADAKNLYRGTILSDLVATNRSSWLADPNTRCSVTLPRPLHEAVQKLQFRQFNYATLMQLKSPLARWIFKRLCHEYINASLFDPYRVLFSSIQRDSGLLRDPRPNRNIKTLNAALDELTAAGTLLIVKQDPIADNRSTFDVQYTLTPHSDFVSDVKAANSRTNAIADTARQHCIETPVTIARAQREAKSMTHAMRIGQERRNEAFREASIASERRAREQDPARPRRKAPADVWD